MQMVYHVLQNYGRIHRRREVESESSAKWHLLQELSMFFSIDNSFRSIRETGTHRDSAAAVRG